MQTLENLTMNLRTLIVSNIKRTLPLPEPKKSCIFVSVGENANLGVAVAYHFEKKGYTVIVGMHNINDGNEFESFPRIIPVELDVTNGDHIEAAKSILERTIELESLQFKGLVLCHMYRHPITIVENIDVDTCVRKTFERNYLGSVRLIRNFSYMLRKHEGRIIIQSDVTGRLPLIEMSHLAASNAAMACLADSVRRENLAISISTRSSQAPIFVSLIEIGIISAEYMAQALLKVDNSSLREREADNKAYRYIGNNHTREEYLKLTTLAGKPHSSVLGSFCDALESKTPKTRYVVGQDARLLSTARALLPDRFIDESIIEMEKYTKWFESIGQEFWSRP